MKISTNQFSKKNFNKVSGTWTDTDKVSANAFMKKAFKKGTNDWEGANTAESAYGVDDMFGGVDSTFGTTPYSGKSHFKLRDDYSPTH